MKLNILLILLFFHKLSAAELPQFSLFKERGCHAQKDYQYLEKLEQARIEELGKFKLSSSIIRRMKVDCAGKKSYAFILNNKVRTHFQTLLVWPMNQTLNGIEILEFTEPNKYKAPINWFQKLKGLQEEGLSGADALSGATLTRQASLKLIKQALILDKELINRK